MKYPKWYTTNTFIGFILFAAYFNPIDEDKYVWNWRYAVMVAATDTIVILVLLNLIV